MEPPDDVSRDFTIIPMLVRRIGILVIAAGIVGMTVFFWDNDPFTAAILIIVDLLLGFLLLSGWRQLAQQERDAQRIAEHKESQKRMAADMPREDRREVSTPLPPASDDDEESG